MTKKICVIGLGYFGYNLALSLSKSGAEVLAVDNHQEKIDEISDKVAHAVCMDSVDTKALKSLGLEDMDAVVVAIGEGFESSLLTTAHLQELGIERIHNRVTSQVHERILKLMKLENLYFPEVEAAEHLKNKLLVPGIRQSYKLDDKHGIYEIDAPKKFVGKTIIQTNLREDYNLNLLTIKRKLDKKSGFLGKKEEVKVIGSPKPNESIMENDILALFGELKDVKNLLEE